MFLRNLSSNLSLASNYSYSNYLLRSVLIGSGSNNSCAGDATLSVCYYLFTIKPSAISLPNVTLYSYIILSSFT